MVFQRQDKDWIGFPG